jgi:hypothetical protein
MVEEGAPCPIPDKDGRGVPPGERFGFDGTQSVYGFPENTQPVFGSGSVCTIIRRSDMKANESTAGAIGSAPTGTDEMDVTLQEDEKEEVA